MDMNCPSTWEVQLVGDAADLRMLAEGFKESEVSIVERGGEFAATGAAFNVLDNPTDVRNRAIEEFTSVSSLARLYLGSMKAIKVGHVTRLGEDGGRHVYLSVDPVCAQSRLSPASLITTSADGTVERHLPAAPLVALLSKAGQSSAVRKVLRLRDRNELVWIDLTVIAEIIKADGFKFSKRDKDDLDRLDGSANHPEVAGDLARHGAPKWDPPPPHKRITLREGCDFVDRIIREWLASK